MNPQTIKYNINDNEVTLLEGTQTFLVKASSLLWGSNSWPPVIYLEGISERKTKFEYYKAYLNSECKILHCEYRDTIGNFKLIVHNN